MRSTYLAGDLLVAGHAGDRNARLEGVVAVPVRVPPLVAVPENGVPGSSSRRFPGRWGVKDFVGRGGQESPASRRAGLARGEESFFQVVKGETAFDAVG